MTTEGQGRAADPVGLGIPVVIDGPWAEPRIYPDMAGILDNPDAAYAKLKEMGKGLFGANGALAAGRIGRNAHGGTADRRDSGSDALGGKLGETLGNLLQQGLARPQPRHLAPTSPGPAAPPPPAHGDPRRSAAGQPADERRAAAVVQPLNGAIVILRHPHRPSASRWTARNLC